MSLVGPAVTLIPGWPSHWARADLRNASWTGWAWWAGDCKFPSLLADWQGTPTLQGAGL